MPSTRLYVGIWAILVFATIVEVVTRSLQLSLSIIVTGIITISIMKAILIAAFYQHLRYEVKILSLIPIGSLAALSLLLLTSILGGM